MKKTLTDILYADRGEATARLHTAFADRDLPGWAAASPGFATRAAGAVLALLDMPIGNFVFAAYRKHRLVEAARAASLETGVPQVVQLLEHTIRSCQQPEVEMEVNGVAETLLTLDLVAEVKIEVVTLVVSEGRIVDTAPGKAIASVAVSLGDTELARAEAEPIDLGKPRELSDVDLVTIDGAAVYTA